MYLGSKGYTIPRNLITPMQERQIRKDLMISPFNLMNQQRAAKGAFSMISNDSFPVFRENEKKIYVPHYYGLKMFGTPPKIQIPSGSEISVPFVGRLRDYQEPVVEQIVSYFRNEPTNGGMLEVPCGWGKTASSMGVISRMGLKTLVIVHKEFLMTQWISSIQTFLPTARVGKIQGSIIDIEDKDIVLCMLQSLVMKEYPLALFASFGLTILDEVHHISSESFSNALFKVKTKHMLGLSATLNRKDGTFFVIEMFLGPVIYKGERKEKFDVLVRNYEFEDTDEEFLDTPVDSRGNIMYSTLVSKVSSYSPRILFLTKVILHEFRTNPNQQMILLSTTRALLTELHQLLFPFFCQREEKQKEEAEDKTKEKKKKTKQQKRNGKLTKEEEEEEKEFTREIEKQREEETENIEGYIGGGIGYYLGGMKQEQLKETEGKKLILGTYSMASEGLDIKTLTTLILATPKTDIEQSVGRILRDKHANPLVIDIIDPHHVFKKQWKKRKTFYNKQKYKCEIVPFYSQPWNHSSSSSLLSESKKEEDDDDNEDEEEDEGKEEEEERKEEELTKESKKRKSCFGQLTKEVKKEKEMC